ncbi:helix-turn-helix transcriptional regulator [Psychrobacillus sp. BM2]|uniref:helix-turn-helix transcriptional regulator n=1 Tax=Psychrobacillus sp. BM2 TaxID=3400421 RepID=UPI003B028FFC
MSENNRFKTLGAFLKSRRNRLLPEQAGLNGSYGRRRTPGLRREEVAILAGVSATYYTWLEQGREMAASREVIENIGKALQLTTDESMHLIQLWDPNESASVPSLNMGLNPQWQQIIDQLTYPSFISNERSEVFAWNTVANEIIADFSSMPVDERVMIRILFVDPELRHRMRNWEEFALHSVAVFRTYYDKHQDDPWFAETVNRLCEDSSEFEAMWNFHHIQLKKVSRVFIHIPSKGKVYPFDINSLSNLDNNPGLHFCIYTPVEGEKAEAN